MVTCYFYWTKSGNYLITHNYAACGAGLASGGWRTPLWARLGSRGAAWESPAPSFFLKSLRDHWPAREALDPVWRGPAPLPCCPGAPPLGRWAPSPGRLCPSARNGLSGSHSQPSWPQAPCWLLWPRRGWGEKLEPGLSAAPVSSGWGVGVAFPAGHLVSVPSSTVLTRLPDGLGFSALKWASVGGGGGGLHAHRPGSPREPQSALGKFFFCGRCPST